MSTENKRGALWSGKMKSGDRMLSIQLEFTQDELAQLFEESKSDGKVTYKLVGFTNSYKSEDKHPDYVLYKSKPRETTRDEEF